MNNALYTPLCIAIFSTIGLSACGTVQSDQQSTTPSSMIDETSIQQSVNTTPIDETKVKDLTTQVIIIDAVEEKDVHAAKTPWTYSGASGANHWGDLEGYSECKNGTEQSPINITKFLRNTDKVPKTKFGISNVKVVNNGHTIVYTPQDVSNTTLINGEIYTLLQFHYHAPSEHQIAGVNYPAEMHFVHANSNRDLAVIGVMLDPTANTAVLGELVDASKTATKNANHTSTVNNVNLRNLLPVNSSFYHYKGSLTTPPCTQNVQWYVAEKALPVTNPELYSLTQLYNDNNRPIQPQGKRLVHFINVNN